MKERINCIDWALQHLYRGVKPLCDFFSCTLCFSASVLLFAWHLLAFFSGQHLLHIILFYPVNLGFLIGVLYGCKLLNTIKSTIIVNLSIGTLVIIGLHIVLVTIGKTAYPHTIRKKVSEFNTSTIIHQ